MKNEEIDEIFRKVMLSPEMQIHFALEDFHYFCGYMPDSTQWWEELGKVLDEFQK